MTEKTVHTPARAPIAPKEISAKDLPLCCPQPEDALWQRHPRVFLELSAAGKAVCPYCSAQYVLTGAVPKAH